MRIVDRQPDSIRLQEGPWARGLGALIAAVGLAVMLGVLFALMSTSTRLVAVLLAPFSFMLTALGVFLLRRGQRTVTVDGVTRTVDDGDRRRPFDEVKGVVVVREHVITPTSGRQLYRVELQFEDGESLRLDSDTIDSGGDATQSLAEDIGQIVGMVPTRHEDSA